MRPLPMIGGSNSFICLCNARKPFPCIPCTGSICLTYSRLSKTCVALQRQTNQESLQQYAIDHMARYCQDNPIGTALRELAEQFLLLPEPGHHTADATG